MSIENYVGSIRTANTCQGGITSVHEESPSVCYVQPVPLPLAGAVKGARPRRPTVSRRDIETGSCGDLLWRRMHCCAIWTLENIEIGTYPCMRESNVYARAGSQAYMRGCAHPLVRRLRRRETSEARCMRAYRCQCISGGTGRYRSFS